MKKYLRLNIQMFGASNSNSATLNSSAGNKATLAISFVENSTSVENNTSSITVTGSLTMTTGSFSVSSSPTLYIYWHDNYTNTDTYVNSKVIQSLSRGNSSSVDGTITATHNSDGSLSGYAIATWSYSGSTTYVPANGSVSTPNTALTTIPRASSVACTTANIGANPTFTIYSAVSTFTHKLYYEFNGITKTLITDTGLTGNTTITYNGWTIPSTFYAQIPNSPYGNGTITCETYSNGQYVGTSTCGFTANVPSTAKPNISNPTIVDTDTVSKNTIGLYVIGKSKLKFTFPNFSTDYGSNLGSYKVLINDVEVYNDIQNTYTMNTALKQASNTYEFIIVDSRGISNTTGKKSLSTAYAYTEPKVTKFEVERDSTTPSTVHITYSGTITNIGPNGGNNKNAKSFKIEYKQSTASSWSTITTATDAYTKTNVALTKTGVSDSNTFDFRITAVDSYNIPATASTQLGTSATLINFSADGTAIAFGKASEVSNTFECSLNANFTGSLKKNGSDIDTKLAVLQAVYPVGAIYISTVPTSPKTLFGFGTWTQIKDTFLLTAGDTYTAGATGGSATHTLTISEMPTHTHEIWNGNVYPVTLNGLGSGTYYNMSYSDLTNQGGQLQAKDRGGSQPFDIMPPYKVVYAWQRTA